MKLEVNNLPKIILFGDLNPGDTFVCPAENFALDEILMCVSCARGLLREMGCEGIAINLLTGEVVGFMEDVVVVPIKTKLVNDEN